MERSQVLSLRIIENDRSGVAEAAPFEMTMINKNCVFCHQWRQNDKKKVLEENKGKKMNTQIEHTKSELQQILCSGSIKINIVLHAVAISGLSCAWI